MIHSIKFDLIRANAVVVHNESFETTKEWILNHYQNIDSEEIENLERSIRNVKAHKSGAFTLCLCNGDAVLYFQENTIESIAHESFHAVCHIMEHRGFQHTSNGEEIAYPLGYLVDEICKLFNIGYRKKEK